MFYLVILQLYFNNIMFLKYVKLSKKTRFFVLHLIFFILILINLFFRLNLSLNLEWFHDDSRDFLVARNIIFDNDYKWIAPYAQWGNNILKNSGFYYYFLSIFAFFSLGNPVLFRILFTLFFFIITLVYSYLLSRLLFEKKQLQLLTVLLFLYSPTFYWYGSYTFQPNFAIPILLSSIYYFYLSYKQNSNKFLSLAVLLYSITTNIHYANLMLFPWVVGITIYTQYKLSKKEKTKNKLKDFFLSQINFPSLILIMNLSFLFVNQFLIVNFKSNKFVFSAFLKDIVKNNNNVLTDFYQNLRIFLNVFLDANYIPNAFFLISILSILVLFLLRKKVFYSLISFIALLSFIPMFFFMKSVGSHQIWYFFPIYVLFIIFLISASASFNHKLSFILLFFLLISYIAQTYPPTKQVLTEKKFDKHSLVAEVIHRDLSTREGEITDFFIIAVDRFINDSNSVYWLHLEQSVKQKLVENDPLNNGYYLLSSIREKSKNIYLICDTSEIDNIEFTREDWCFEKFQLKNILENHHLLFSSDENELSIYHLILQRPIDKYEIYFL